MKRAVKQTKPAKKPRQATAKPKSAKARGPKVLRRRAIRIEQSPKHPLYLFTLTGEELSQIADISRVSRDEASKLLGYQRPEVKQHIGNIVEYLDSGDVLFPNSIILALSSSISFKQTRGPKVDETGAFSGTLEIPLPSNGQSKPAWIVDGQQRVLALSKSTRNNLLVPVNGFVADDIDIQRDQFLRINSAKPLPRGLITELLPEVGTSLPSNLAARKIPSSLCDLLNRDPASPFQKLIYRSSSSPEEKKQAVINDNSIVRMLQDSLNSASGSLFSYRNLATNETNFPEVQTLLLMFWGAVKETFPEAWGLPPNQSRLMHGVGIRSMGKLMDRMMGSINLRDPKSPQVIRTDLARLKDRCHWTSGAWEELGNMQWNELQNLPAHIRILSNFLIRSYLQTRELA